MVLAPLYASLAREPCVEATDPDRSAGAADEDSGGKRFPHQKWIAPSAGVFPDVSSEALRASFAPDGDLARAFAARGEWVIHGVPNGVIQAFVKHAPCSVRVATPRLARDLVRAAPRDAAAAYARSSDKKLALAWLSYCLSDLDFGDAMGAAALRDAPLLPLADGTLGSFRFGDGCRDPLETNVVFVPSDESEANVLTEMGRRKNDKAALSKLVDRSVFVENDASPLYDRILAFAKGAIGAASNVKPIDAGGLASLLPDLLPDAWGVAVADERSRRTPRRRRRRGGGVVPGARRNLRALRRKRSRKKHLDHPTYDALAALWRLFVAKSPNTLAPFEGWPLLPVDEGERLAPLTPHGALVRGEGWSEHAASAVRALGVSRLHECAATSVAVTHTSISLYARAASAAGVLDSAVAGAAATPEATRAARAFKVDDAPTASAPELRWRAAASVVPAAFEKNLASESEADAGSARRALRAFLLQTRWFAPDAPGGAVEGARLDLFRARCRFSKPPTEGSRAATRLKFQSRNFAPWREEAPRARFSSPTRAVQCSKHRSSRKERRTCRRRHARTT